MGYAFHLGGAHALNPDNAELTGLDMLFAPSGWGLIGLKGFALSGDNVTPTVLSLFLTYLPLVAAAVFLVMLSLIEVRLWVGVLAGALLGTIVFPLAACWVWGGGWLATLGENAGMAHGFVDFGGSSLVLWLPGTVALGVLLLQTRTKPEPPLRAPPAHFPLLANVGALILGIGWIGWALSEPFHTYGAMLDWNRTAISALLGMAGAVLTSQLYTWLVTGELEPLMVARGLTAGWSALLAGAPFLAPWAALVAGLLVGILFPLSLYVLETYFRGDQWRNAAATVALGLTGGLWGLLSVALFADGRWGFGWNGIGVAESLQPMGVTGVFSGNIKQITAQLTGLLAIGTWGLICGVVLGLIVRLSSSKKSVKEEASPRRKPSIFSRVLSQANKEKAEEKSRSLREDAGALDTVVLSDDFNPSDSLNTQDSDGVPDTDNGRSREDVEFAHELGNRSHREGV
jgi:ammonia channel protein AmtB